MRRTKEEAERTKQQILDAALAEFSNKGYQAARLQDIASRAGTTRGAIYHHYQNKAGLYRSLVEAAAQKGNVAVERAIAEGGTFAEICRRILIISLEILEDDPQFRQVTALSLYKTGISAELADIDAERLLMAEQSIRGIADYMQFGIENGEVGVGRSPLAMARAFLALQNGLAWLWLSTGEQFSLTNDAEEYADILLHGLLAD